MATLPLQQLVSVHLQVTLSGHVIVSLHTADVQPSCRKLISSSSAVGLVHDAVMELHLREDHPEHPSRVRELQRRLQEAGLLSRCCRLKPKLASDMELLRSHSRDHINKVEALYHCPIDKDGNCAELRGDTYIITSDIYCNQHTAMAARSAAGCSVRAVQAVVHGEVGAAFAIVRPPGHHAEAEELMGFCFYNNVAVAAHAALQEPGIDRVVIVDWDIHHGNGTQNIFKDDDRVLFVSLHRRDGDFYPAGCGFATEVGSGKGTGYTVNIPWTSKGIGDADYLTAFDLILEPILTQFAPQLVLISAGFDAAEGDFLGKCCVTPAGFAAMTQRLKRHAGGRLVAVLEGGYVPSIVGECSCAVMQVLLGDPAPQLQPSSFNMHRSTKALLSKVDSIQRHHWSLLAQQPPFAAAFQAYNSALKLQSLRISESPSSGHGTRSNTRKAAAAAAAVGESGSTTGLLTVTAAPADKPLASCAPMSKGRLSRTCSSRKDSSIHGQDGAPAAAAAGKASTRKSSESSSQATASKPGGKGTSIIGPALREAFGAAAGLHHEPAAPAAAEDSNRPKIRIKLKKNASLPLPSEGAGPAVTVAADSAGPAVTVAAGGAGCIPARTEQAGSTSARQTAAATPPVVAAAQQTPGEAAVAAEDSVAGTSSAVAVAAAPAIADGGRDMHMEGVLHQSLDDPDGFRLPPAGQTCCSCAPSSTVDAPGAANLTDAAVRPWPASAHHHKDTSLHLSQHDTAPSAAEGAAVVLGQAAAAQTSSAATGPAHLRKGALPQTEQLVELLQSLDLSHQSLPLSRSDPSQQQQQQHALTVAQGLQHMSATALPWPVTAPYNWHATDPSSSNKSQQHCSGELQQHQQLVLAAAAVALPDE